MLFKRVIPNIKQQNWLAVGLDFLVVVFGVFLGLQVSLWNEERKAENDTQALLERLKSESIEYVKFWQANTNWYAQQLDDHMVMVNAINGGQASKEEESMIARSLITVSYYPTISVTDTVLSEVLEEHQYNMLKNQKLKEAITRYNNYLEFIKGQLSPFRDSARSIREIYHDRVYYTFDPGQEFKLSVDFDFATLAEDKNFKSNINELVRNQLMFQSYRELTLKAAIELCNVATSNSPDCQKSPVKD